MGEKPFESCTLLEQSSFKVAPLLDFLQHTYWDDGYAFFEGTVSTDYY